MNIYKTLGSLLINSNKVIIILFFFSGVLLSQNKPLSKNQFITDSLKIVKDKIVRPQFRIDNRTVFSRNQVVNITGFDAGVLLKDKLRVTLGYYSLSANNLSIPNKEIGLVLYKPKYQLDYGALNLEFIYKNTRFFSFGMPVEFGLGQNQITYNSTLDDSRAVNETKTELILLSHFGLSGTFKPIRWIGLKVSVGYRKTIMNKLIDVNFDGIYSSVGLAIDFREIIRDGRMYALKRKYRKNFNSVGTAVDLITD